MEGILKEVNNELVLIDSKWYKVQKPEYLPKEVNIKVSFSTLETDAATIKFIKAVVAGEEKKSFTKPYVKSYGQVAKEAAPVASAASSTKVAPEDVRNTSIVRQVIFKGAVELVCAGKFPTVEAAMEAVKSMETYLTGK